MDTRKNSRLWSIISVLMICVLTAGLFSSCGGNSETSEAEDEAEPVVIMNPFTGDLDYSEDAYNRRPVAIVVENSPEARPQWGIDDENYSPDIIVQGEVEGGITRTLWLYADYTKLPDVIGPIRSARPPFIRFSKFFDSIFIHWGYSHSKEGYVGADKTFKNLDVDHIDRMWYENDVPLYDRSTERNVATEHTGIIYGDKVEAAIKDLGFRTEREGCSTLSFNDSVTDVGTETAGEVTVRYSTEADGYDMTWTYNEEDGLYHTNHFETDVARENLIVLSCNTDYIPTTSYTYCNYVFGDGGTGKLFSNGTVTDFKWEADMDNFILTMYTEEEYTEEELAELQAAAEEAAAEAEKEGDEEAAAEAAEIPTVKKTEIKLNPGKSWIGMISGNNGGSVSVTPRETTSDTSSES